GARYLDARCAGTARQVGELVAAHRTMVTRPARGGRLMLFVHEKHEVVGLKEDEFETLYRTGWMPMLAEGDDARLLWYMNHAHGSGPAYNVVTITGVKDGAAWERLDQRIRTGDLREWTHSVDGCRHNVTAKVMLPVHWSPIQEVDCADVQTDAREHQ